MSMVRYDHHKSPEPRSDEWLTPFEFIEELGPYDYDPACPANMPWATAARMITEAENGLIQEWKGRVFLNPPYRKTLIDKFMAKMAEHNHGTALVNSRTDTAWFHRFVWPVASACLFVYQRIRFVPLIRGLERHHNGHASVLVAYGPYDADRLEACKIEGAFVPLPGSCQMVAVFRPGTTKTWGVLIEEVCRREGGKLTLQAAYVLLGRHPKRYSNPNYQAKIRQILQGPAFSRIDRGTYQLKGAAA